MKKTQFNINRKEIQKRIKQNLGVDKEDFLKLVKRASQPKHD